MAVHSAYRGLGIATEMLKVRPMLLKALGLKVTTSHFVGIAGQNAAAKAGYEENFVISYDEFNGFIEFELIFLILVTKNF